MILSIAGSDSSAKAGIQMDIRVGNLLNTEVLTAVTCLVAQNNYKVDQIFCPPCNFLRKQIEISIFKKTVNSIKIGVMGNINNINIVSDLLKNKLYSIPLIFDPVISASSGFSLYTNNIIESIKKRIIPFCYLVTPNISEAEILSNTKICNLYDMEIAAKRILELGARNVLVTGGHLNEKDNMISHILLSRGNKIIFTNKRLEKNIRGTGCMLSTAIAVFINKNYNLELSIKKANKFVYNKIKNYKED